MTPETRRLRDAIRVAIEEQRDRLEGNLPELQTATLRGSIAALRWVVDQVDPAPTPDPSPAPAQDDPYPC